MIVRSSLATAAWIVFVAVMFIGWGFILMLMIAALG